MVYVRLHAYLLRRDAKGVHSEQLSLVENDFEGDCSEISDHGTYFHVTNGLIRSFHTEELLRDAQDKVVPAKSPMENSKGCPLR